MSTYSVNSVDTGLPCPPPWEAMRQRRWEINFLLPLCPGKNFTVRKHKENSVDISASELHSGQEHIVWDWGCPPCERHFCTMEREYPAFGVWEISVLSLLYALEQVCFFTHKMKIIYLFHKVIKWKKTLVILNHCKLGSSVCLFITVEQSLCCLGHFPFWCLYQSSPQSWNVLQRGDELKDHAVFKLRSFPMLIHCTNCPKFLFPFLVMWPNLGNLEEHSSIFISLLLNLEPKLKC